MADEPYRKLVPILGSDVKTLPLRWWDEGLVLRAAINLVAAREGKGKSTAAASWGARETNQGGTVMWIGTEESREHAQAPRLQAAAADMNRVIFVDVETDTGTGALVFPLDLVEIEKLIIDHQVTMIILDPCKGLMPSGFSGNDDIAIRQYLEPIAALASRRDLVILGLVHFGKRESADTGKLILGSAAWSQVARTVLSIADDPETGNRVLTNTKSNYSATDRSVEFQIVSKTITTSTGVETEFGVVEWIGDTDKDARDFLGEERRPTEDEFDTKDYSQDLKSTLVYKYLDAAHKASKKVRPKEAIAYCVDHGQSRATVNRQFKKLKNAGFAESVDGKEFPYIAYWQITSDEPDAGKAEPGKPKPGEDEQLTLQAAQPEDDETTEVSHVEGEPTETTGSDQAKQGETTAVDETIGETTAETYSDQPKQDQESPVVSVGSRTAREWLANHIAGLQNAGHTTVKSLAVYKAAEAAGFRQTNVAVAVGKHPDIWVIDRKGGTATWSIERGQQPPPDYQSVADWLNSWLDRQTSDRVLPADARAAGEAAGHTWETLRRTAGFSRRIKSVPAKGAAKSDRIWLLQPAQDEGTA
jgi:AAA domain